MTIGYDDGLAGERVDVQRSGRVVSVEKTAFVLVAVYVGGLLGVVVGPYVPSILSVPLVVVALTFVPGGLTILALLGSVKVDARTLLYAYGLSLLEVMATAAAICIVLPLVGVQQPLSRWPLAGGLTVLVAVLAVAALRSDDGRSVTVPSFDLLQPAPLALLSLPLASVLAVSYLNRTLINVPILAVLVAVAVLPFVLVTLIDERWHALGVFSIGLTLLYHNSLWAVSSFGGSPGVVRAWEARQWTPGVFTVDSTSTELLQNGVLFPTYARLATIDIMTELQVVNPFLVAFLPLAIFVAFRSYLDSTRAVLGVSFFMFAHPFYNLYPTAGRAATPVVFLALLALVLSDSIRSSRASVLVLAFGSGVVVTHYGTSFFVMFALIGALLILTTFHRIELLLDHLGWYTSSRLEESDEADCSLWQRLLSADVGRAVFSVPFVLFYTASAMAWYLFAAGGEKFKTLPNHTMTTIQQFTGGTYTAGRTAARVERNYGSVSIRLSKYVYLLMGVLMLIGFLAIYYYRFFSDEEVPFGDAYLAISTMMFGLFGSTFMFSTWGGGRPMMITFVFTACFAAIGASIVGWGARAGWRTVRSGNNFDGVASVTGRGVAVMAPTLAILLLLSTGVASAVVLHDQAPSEVPNPSKIENSHRTVDTATHVWINDHGEGNIWGDYTTHGQTDWYLPEIEYETEGHQSYDDRVGKPRGDLLDLREPGIEPGYVMLTGHNIDDGVITRPYLREDVPLSELQPELDDRHVVYSAGSARIYYWPPPPAE